MQRYHYGVLFLIMGLVYMAIEVSYGALISLNPSLKGSSSLWMLLVGGLCGSVLGLLNEACCSLKDWPRFLLVLFGALLVTLIELASGCVLNLWWGLDLWDYSKSPFNFLGQINLMHSCLWVLLTPTAFWLDDAIRHYVFGERKPAAWITYYRVF